MVHLLELVTVSLQGVLKLVVKTSKKNLQASRLCRVMRKMEMIENLKNSGSLNKFLSISQRTVWRICILTLGCKALNPDLLIQSPSSMTIGHEVFHTCPIFFFSQLYSLSSGELLCSFVFDVGVAAVTMDAAEQNCFAGGTDGNIYQVELFRRVSIK